MATEGITPYGRHEILTDFFGNATHAKVQYTMTYTAAGGGGTAVFTTEPVPITFAITVDNSTATTAAVLQSGTEPVFPLALGINVPRPSDQLIVIDSVEVTDIILTNGFPSGDGSEILYYEAPLSASVTFSADGELTITNFTISMTVVTETLLA